MIIIDTANWDWPQWTWIIIVLLGFMYVASKHGEHRLEEDGTPEKYNAITRAIAIGISIFLLGAGGFFQ